MFRKLANFHVLIIQMFHKEYIIFSGGINQLGTLNKYPPFNLLRGGLLANAGVLPLSKIYIMYYTFYS